MIKPAFSGWHWQKQTIISQLWGRLTISIALLLLGGCSYQIDSFYSPSITFLRRYMFLKYWFSLARVERLRKISISTGLLFTIWPTFHIKSNKTCFPPHIERSSTLFIIYNPHLHQIATKSLKQQIDTIFQGTLPFFCDKSWPKQEGWLRWEKN